MKLLFFLVETNNVKPNETILLYSEISKLTIKKLNSF